MESVLAAAIEAAQRYEITYTKFISANDVGKTSHERSRSHQAGFYISRSFVPYIFEQEIVRDTDYELFVTIKWQRDFDTNSRFKYYGSKNECHLTRLGANFPFRSDSNIGDLLILCKAEKDYYYAFVLQFDEEIEDFFASVNISATDTDKLIPAQREISAEDKLLNCFLGYARELNDFPKTSDLALNARLCYNAAYKVTDSSIASNPDRQILKWLEAEYQLFKTIENDRYSERIKNPFRTVEELIGTANTILNRRKSRAGKSLEHHLTEVFNRFELQFATQAVTEENKKPDFIFPNAKAYHDTRFDEKKLVLLASKTTCKDRWRQVLNEADRIEIKHLFTLQQGISRNQLQEMYKYNVCLVVPHPYINSFPKEFRDKIFSLEKFLQYVQEKQR
ncbi:MAG TPA: type II restriction endonuclease [Chitinophagaceae bacterium]|nr:type II restriction endonuclease [Chitinophagaceae bacterium]